MDAASCNGTSRSQHRTQRCSPPGQLRHLLDAHGRLHARSHARASRVRRGVSVCLDPAWARTFRRSAWSDVIVAHWLQAHPAELRRPGRYVGGWLDPNRGHVWLDVVRVLPAPRPTGCGSARPSSAASGACTTSTPIAWSRSRRPADVPAVSGRLLAWRDREADDPRRGERTAAILGLVLGISFTVCFLTGLLSHLIQHPPGWFTWVPRPAGLYRVTQGVHVATGIVAIPILLAKLWTVAPRLLQTPVARDVSHALERLSLLPLVGGALFLLVTGVANIDLWYPWPFFFPAGHYWVAWITIGALIVHIGAKLHVTRTALAHPPVETAAAGLSRRRFLLWVGAGSATLTALTSARPSRRSARSRSSPPGVPTTATRASRSTRRPSRPTW